jgi:invasion protein IalB
MQRLSAFLLSLLLFASVAGAQTRDTGALSRDIRIAAQGPWTVDCTPEPQTGEKWCQVGTIFESNEPPYSLQFNYVRDTRMFFAMGAVRLTGVHLQVDGQAAFTLDRCLGGICMLKGTEADRLLQLLRAGKQLSLRFESQTKLPPLLTVDLAAFEPMYRRALAAPK